MKNHIQKLILALVLLAICPAAMADTIYVLMVQGAGRHKKTLRLSGAGCGCL
jgi:hypothetical protein